MEKLRNALNEIDKSHLRLPTIEELKKSIRSFSKLEWIVFIIFFVLFFVSSISLLNRVNNFFTIEIPTTGGVLTEGMIDAPRFVNPVLAFSNTDKSLSLLIYSGLMRKTSQGEIVKDLASGYEISEDGLIYTFTILDDAAFHDGKPVTAHDVVYTIQQAQDSILKSPRRLAWEGVDVEAITDKTVVFTLKQPYAPFLSNVTMGIIPQHVWKDISIEEFSFSDFNIDAVGSGPYKINKIKKKSSGIVDSFELTSFRRFTLGRPYINKMIIRFYPNERELFRAFDGGEIEQISAITGSSARVLEEKNYRIESSTLPRIFGLFFNQNEAPIFTDSSVVKAFNIAIDKEEIIEEVLSGYGVPINGPIPGNLGSQTIETFTQGDEANPVEQDTREKTESEEENGGTATSAENAFDPLIYLSPGQQEAIAILENAGWKSSQGGIMEKNGNKLAFSISTSDVPELKRAAELLQEDLMLIGASVELRVFEAGNLNQNVIRPRKYDALFFGQIIGRESDLFAFWHSSQRNDPGLNVSLYANATVDSLLEKALTTLDDKERLKIYTQFEQEIMKDAPGVFIYSPDLIYVVSRRVKGFVLESVSSVSERFLDVYKWYIETDRIWRAFNKYNL